MRVLRLVGLDNTAEGAPTELGAHPGPGVEKWSPCPAHRGTTTTARCLPRRAALAFRAVGRPRHRDACSLIHQINTAPMMAAITPRVLPSRQRC